MSKLQKHKESMYDAMAQAEKSGASAVKISLSHDDGISTAFENGRLRYADSAESMSFGIMVIVNGKFGRAAANQPEMLKDMVARAIQFAQIGAPAHYATFPKPAKSYAEIASYDEAAASIPRQKLIDDCRELVDHIRSLHPSMVAEASGSRSSGETIIINNSGLYDEFQESSWSIGAGFTKTTGTDMLFCHSGRAWGKLDNHYDMNYIKATLTDDFQNASRTARLPDGAYPLLLPPLFVRRFLAPVIMALSGYKVYLGVSPLKDKLDQTPFHSSFTLIDNPFIDYLSTSANMDDCGIPTQKRFLIEKGRVCQFLYDYDTANLVNAAPTGNSGCAPYTAVLPTGTLHSSELFKGIRRGLFIRQLLGFGQSNFANGDFSANVQLGYVIENGEITGRIKDAMIAGNVFEMLSHPVVTSSDEDPCSLTPYVLFDKVNLFSK